MAKRPATAVKIWMDYYDLSGFLNSAQQDVKQATVDVTCIGDTGPRRLADNYDHSLSHAGFIDTADNSFDEQAFALVASDSDHYFAALWDGSSEGAILYEQIARLSGQPRSAAVRGGQLLSLSAEGSGGIARSTLLRNATISANGNGTGRNCGVSTAGQVFQTVIRVFSGTFTGFTVKLQESQNDGGADPYADIATLSQAVTAAGVWRLTTTAATEAWKRVVIADWNGTDALVGVTAGIVAGT